MKLLHGSNVEIEQPLLEKCQSNNDFGQGFYMTPSWQRAWEMGRRRVNFYGGEISISTFLYYPKAFAEKGLQIKEFKGFSTEWARFIISNRDDEHFVHPYDVVVGPVADAILDRELKIYKKEFGEAYLEDDNLRVFISRISQFGSSYLQYCFCTQKAMDELIKY